MKRVQYFSDLHMEMRDYDITAFDDVEADLVILAGDIGVGVNGVRWAAKVFKCPVLYVAGNHEFYHHEFGLLIEDMKNRATGTNVTVLEDDSVVINDIRYVGSTLWTDFNLYGYAEQAMDNAADCMSDFHLIRGRSGPLQPIETVQRHERSAAYISKVISISKEPVVVITHHTPSKLTVPPKYANDGLTPAFSSNLDSVIRPPVIAWICGHTHHSGQWDVHGIPILSNQWGYPSEGKALPRMSLGNLVEAP